MNKLLHRYIVAAILFEKSTIMSKSLYAVAVTLAIILLFIVNKQVKQTTTVANIVKSEKANIQVIIYSKAGCLYCTSAKELLSSENINYIDIDISDNNELRQKLIKDTKQLTVPYIFINGKFIGGYQQLANLKKTTDFDTYFQTREFTKQ